MDMQFTLKGRKELENAAGTFLKENQDSITEFIRKEPSTAEEYLRKSLLLDLLEQTSGVKYVLEYLEKDVVSQGTLRYNDGGELCLGEKVLKDFEEVEVFFFDEDLEQEVWVRTYPVKRSVRTLAGLGERMPIEGLQARFRA